LSTPEQGATAADRGLRALVWDVDGTLAETERDGHRVAFNRAFTARSLPWQWSEQHYGRLLAITGGRERLLYDMASRAAAPTAIEERAQLAHTLHRLKNDFYAEIVRQGQIALRPGVLELLRDCRDAGVRMAIATTTSRTNVAALLAATLGSRWSEWFEVVVCGEDVTRKKPDPEVYSRVLQGLQLPAAAAVAIEDSPAGAAAARAAGLQVVLTRSAYFAEADATAATAVGPGLDDASGWRPAVRDPARRRVRLSDLSSWCYSRSVNSD
jgi:HAD superfamily hydrolase (TIGR01509 family)